LTAFAQFLYRDFNFSNMRMSQHLNLFLLFAFLGTALPVPAHGQITENSEGIYLDDNGNPYTGSYIEYYPSGAKKDEIHLRNGLKEGICLLFFDDGQLNEIRSYKQGKMHGTWITYNQKGTKIGEANYSQNLKNGKWYIWDENGTLRYEMFYLDGEKVGIWLMWNEKGELAGHKEYGSLE
jgi:antitoxin component YwqK of YwqJK toxin-antitoxin module